MEQEASSLTRGVEALRAQVKELQTSLQAARAQVTACLPACHIRACTMVPWARMHYWVFRLAGPLPFLGMQLGCR